MGGQLGGGKRFHLGEPSVRRKLSIAGAWRLFFWRGLAACRGPWHQAARCAGTAHAFTGYDKEFPSKFAGVAVGQRDTATPVDLCPYLWSSAHRRLGA